MSLQALRKGLLRLPSMAARPARSASTNPAAESFGPLEIIVGLCSFYGAALGPTAYILANLDSYKKKE